MDLKLFNTLGRELQKIEPLVKNKIHMYACGPAVTCWMHGEFLIAAKGKMSKSSGNFFIIDGLKKKGYDPLDYRYFCLSGHYRSQLQFSLEALDSARNARKNRVLRIAQLKNEVKSDFSGQGDVEEVVYYKSFISHALDDLNMPKCLSDLWNLVKDLSVPPLHLS